MLFFVFLKIVNNVEKIIQIIIYSIEKGKP